jgi:hypothetical protein
MVWVIHSIMLCHGNIPPAFPLVRGGEIPHLHWGPKQRTLDVKGPHQCFTEEPLDSLSANNCQ